MPLFPYHTYLTVLVPAIITFAVTFYATKFIIDYFYGAGVIDEDHNKAKVIKLPSSGGVAVAFGIILGALAYTFGGSFLFNPLVNVSELLAASLSIILITFVGFIDDINVGTKRVVGTDLKRLKVGLKQWQKPLLTVVGAIPLMAINAGVSTISIPLLGIVDFGLIYPILILPIAVIFVSNAFNLLGGFDGLQSGMATITALGLLLYSTFFGTYIAALLSAVLFAALLAFWPFNKYMAKIIPGDSFTYCVGGAFVAIMALGNAEAFGFIIFIPWLVEFFLHLRGRFHVSDLGIRQKDGTFRSKYGKKIYSLTHVAMNIKPMKEYEVSNWLMGIEAMFVVLAFLLQFAGLL
ncbi:MAG: hypothetical protein KGH49_03190 [Candidatus Micrarchaeota archaeon]|nr:hypothetical protein [Candidatus Micrarchaeota archaeon]